MYKIDDTVQLNPPLLEDSSLKANHHLLKRIMEEDRKGTIREIDTTKSTPEISYYWVKFHYAAFLLNQSHISPA